MCGDDAVVFKRNLPPCMFPCLMLMGPMELILSDSALMKIVGGYSHSRYVDRDECTFRAS